MPKLIITGQTIGFGAVALGQYPVDIQLGLVSIVSKIKQVWGYMPGRAAMRVLTDQIILAGLCGCSEQFVKLGGEFFFSAIPFYQTVNIIRYSKSVLPGCAVAKSSIFGSRIKRCYPLPGSGLDEAGVFIMDIFPISFY